MRPYVTQVATNERLKQILAHEQLKSIDTKRCYPSLLMNNKTPYAIFGIGDDAQPFSPEMELLPGE